MTIRYRRPKPPYPDYSACPGPDTNADCVVDISDLANVLSNFGLRERTTIAPLNGDVNFDGQTDIEDLATILNAFGANCE